MSIELKENEWAEQMLRSHSLGKKPAETLRRISRYYIDKGYTVKNVRSYLEKFLLQCDPNVSLLTWSNTIDKAISIALKRPAIDIDYIEITDKEMQRIDSLKGKQIKRLAFTLLCLAKYWRLVIPDSDYWVNNKDSEIMAMANINTSIKRQGQMYWTLYEEEMVGFSKRIDNTHVRVCFVEDGIPILKISDFRNLGFQYLMYHGEPFFRCCNCGLVTKFHDPKNRRRQKYCSNCAIKIQTRQHVEAVSRYNQKQNIFKN